MKSKRASGGAPQVREAVMTDMPYARRASQRACALRAGAVLECIRACVCVCVGVCVLCVNQLPRRTVPRRDANCEAGCVRPLPLRGSSRFPAPLLVSSACVLQASL